MIAYLVGEFPSRTEHFILHEIVHLREKGLNIRVLALKRGSGSVKAGHFNQISPIYTRPFLFTIGAHAYVMLKEKKRYFKALLAMLNLPQWSLYRMLRNIKIFSTGVDLLFRLRGSGVKHIHAHFISFPTDVAMVMSGISGLSFSASAHAKDIYTCRPEKLKTIIQSASFVITCTAANKLYLERSVSVSQRDKIIHVYHGIDHQAWPFRPGSGDGKIRILSVGRLVEKKGLIYLLRAVSLLKQGNHPVHCNIAGDGPLRKSFQHYIDREDLADVVTLCGELSQDEIRGMYKVSDIFVLPCIVAPDGDRDGLPNVLLEALCSGLPVITTAVSAIPELILHGATGLLVPEKEPVSIAESVLQLVQNKELYARIAFNGSQKVKQEFGIEKSTSCLIGIFKQFVNQGRA